MAAGLPTDFCPVCFGPNVRGKLVVVLEGGVELERCSACDRPVDATGPHHQP